MAWDSVWESIFQQQEWGKYPNEELVRFIARNFYNVPDRRDVKILEVGCGTGANLWFVAREGFSVYGVDGSETAISRAVSRLDKEVDSWNGQLWVGDIVDLPFPDESFDAVIDCEAICCNSFEDSKRIYTEMSRVLKPNGKLFSKTFAEGTKGRLLEGKSLIRLTTNDEIYDLIGESIELVDLECVMRSSVFTDESYREYVIQGVKK